MNHQIQILKDELENENLQYYEQEEEYEEEEIENESELEGRFM